MLYLLHGGGDDETGGLKKGDADVIPDNLIAEGKAVPMTVVMPHGAVRPMGQPGRGDLARAFADFEADLMRDVIPYVESHDFVKTDRENRAIGDLSMGSFQSLPIGAKHLDSFVWIVAFSGVNYRGPAGDIIANPKGASEKLKLFGGSYGESEVMVRDGAFLDEGKIPHEFYAAPGGHDWTFWRSQLHQVAQRPIPRGAVNAGQGDAVAA